MESEQQGRPFFFFSAGEPSGDLHAAELIRELRERFPNASFAGCGGPKMKEAGCRIDVPLTDLAVMGIGRVLWNLRLFLRYLRKVHEIFQKEKPDAVVLVDFPGFNWQVAKRAKKEGIPVFYFIPPQIWAWAQGRVKKMKRLVDHVLCPLAFEENWYRARNCDVHRIGHPFFEEVRKKELDRPFIEQLRSGPNGPILTLLPGSRDQEVDHNLSEMFNAVEKIRKQIPSVQPIIAAFKDSQADRIRRFLEKKERSIPVFVGRTPELMEAAVCCIAVSGSVSLELLAHRKPTVIYYRVDSLSHTVFRFFCRVKYITLTNLIAVDRLPNESIFYNNRWGLIPKEPSNHDRDLMVFPEYITPKDRSGEVAAHIINWLSDPAALQKKQEELSELLQWADADGDPVRNAADYFVKIFQNKISQKENL
ncbi:MAG: lipid-A-disaccharide synthase [Planctomycetia bacterium]|nr:lipid-A-disaccharide synthase [Planctomycetia bacterium]